MPNNQKRYRERADLNTQELAEASGVSKSMVNSFELGKRKPNIWQAEAIAKVLGGTPGEIYPDCLQETIDLLARWQGEKGGLQSESAAKCI